MHHLMHDTPSEPLISIAKAAARLGIDRSVLSRQAKNGQIRSHGKKVRFSEVLADRAANIDLARSDRRKGRSGADEPAPAEARASKRASSRASPDARSDARGAEPPAGPGQTSAAAPEPDPDGMPLTVTVDGRTMTRAEALTLKETCLALSAELQLKIKSQQVYDADEVDRQFGTLAQTERDAWRSWPPRVAIEMAEQIKFDPVTGKADYRVLASVLSEFVNQHLTEMGEPYPPDWPLAG